jgi:hypothetical protein
VQLEILRNGKPQTLTERLGTRPTGQLALG